MTALGDYMITERVARLASRMAVCDYCETETRVLAFRDKMKERGLKFPNPDTRYFSAIDDIKKAGSIAAMNGIKEDENPYCIPSEREAWFIGYLDALGGDLFRVSNERNFAPCALEPGWDVV